LAAWEKGLGLTPKPVSAGALPPFRFGVDEAKNSESEMDCFIERNERLRDGGRTPFKSLDAQSGNFAGLFVFNRLRSISFRDSATAFTATLRRAPSSRDR
jgi:hypothetical protein